MLHSLARWFSRVAMSAALLSLVSSSIASAQLRHYVAPEGGLNTRTRPTSKFQTPAEQALIPFLKAHVSSLKSGSVANDRFLPMDTTYTSTPPFGGYVNATNFPARNTASLATPVYDTATVVELGADFDKDGKTDIAVLQEDGTLNILLNDGKGGLKAPVSYLNPNYPTTNVFVAYAVDVNGDGYPDVVAYDYANNATITWLNLGDGTFNAAVTTSLDGTYGLPSMAYLADVNGDGKADVIFANIVLSPDQTNSTIYLETQLGKGDGTFGAASAAKVETLHFPVPALQNINIGIAIADINGDGKMDIAIAINEILAPATGAYLVTTALGNNDGTFTGLGTNPPISIPVIGSGPFPVLNYNASILNFVDVNGDGTPDLVADCGNTLETALGKGDGTFSAPVTTDISAVEQPGSTVLVDVNNDGKPDAIIAGDTLGVYLGKGDGTFAPPVPGSQYVTDFITQNSVVVADFDNDGVKDIAVLGQHYSQVSLFSNTSQGGFRGAPLITAESDPAAALSSLVTSGVYAPDGFTSPLLNYNFGTDLVTMLSDGKGNFTSIKALPAYPLNAQYFEPIHADFNGDGFEDIVYADSTGGVWVALSKGDGTFATPVSAGFPPMACPVYYGAAGDINGDGKADLVIPYGGDSSCGASGGGASGYYVALGKGDGTFAAPVFTAAGTELYKLVLGDINGDGKLDLILDDAPFDTGFGFQVSYAVGNGDGTFGIPSVVVQNYLVSDISIADINNDGKADLVLSSEEIQGNDISTGGIILITGNGDGTFNSPSQIATGNFFLGLQTADMNNDGNTDIVATLYLPAVLPVNYYGMVTLLGYGNGTFSAPYNSFESYLSTLPQVGNFVNDNAPDVMTNTSYGPALFIGQGSSSITLTTSATSMNYGSPETLSATVTSGMVNLPAATGTVSFYNGTTLLGMATVTSGKATWTTTMLPVGKNTVKAVYSGDNTLNPSTSANVAITVTALSPAFTLSGTPSTLSIARGATGVVTLNLAANATFSGAITLSCSGMPTNSSCMVNPGSITLAPSTGSTATLVVGTTGTHAELRQPANPWETPAAAASLAGLLGVFIRRRKRVRMLAILGLGVILSLGTLLTGCSSGGNGGGGSSVSTVTAGTYNVTVTATPFSGSMAPVQTTQVSLTIQ